MSFLSKLGSGLKKVAKVAAFPITAIIKGIGHSNQEPAQTSSSPIGPSPNVQDAITRGKLAAQNKRPTRFVA